MRSAERPVRQKRSRVNRGNYLVSFCGFAPADDPQALVYVVIDEPHVEDQAHSSYASSVFSQIMGIFSHI